MFFSLQLTTVASACYIPVKTYFVSLIITGMAIYSSVVSQFQPCDVKVIHYCMINWNYIILYSLLMSLCVF